LGENIIFLIFLTQRGAEVSAEVRRERNARREMQRGKCKERNARREMQGENI
jgi:hypothetical protein